MIELKRAEDPTRKKPMEAMILPDGTAYKCPCGSRGSTEQDITAWTAEHRPHSDDTVTLVSKFSEDQPCENTTGS